MLVEAKHQDNTDGDASVGEIEDGGEEVAATEARKPIRDDEQADVDHVDHATVHEGSVTVNQSVKGGIDDIAESAGDNQRKHAHREGVNFIFSNAIPDKIDQIAHDAQSEERQGQFTQIVTEAETESHAGIFYKIQVEPLPDEGNGFSDFHVRLHPDFQKLVEQDTYNYNRNRDNCEFLTLFQNRKVIFLILI